MAAGKLLRRWIGKGAPEGTQSFVLIVDDPDNPKKTIVHWVIYDLPATATSLPEGVSDKAKLAGRFDAGEE